MIHFINHTPIEWYAKKQATLAFGSMFLASKMASDQILYLQITP